jgi:hypothetical protein
MNANAVPVLSIFEKKMRLEVPLFQRISASTFCPEGQQIGTGLEEIKGNIC